MPYGKKRRLVNLDLKLKSFNPKYLMSGGTFGGPCISSWMSEEVPGYAFSWNQNIFTKVTKMQKENPRFLHPRNNLVLPNKPHNKLTNVHPPFFSP